MSIILAIIGVILGLIFIIVHLFSEDLNGVLLGILVVVINCLCLISDLNPQPTAMDVYQGKTTLKYTYVDNIPVDSIVIWKEDYE